VGEYRTATEWHHARDKKSSMTSLEQQTAVKQTSDGRYQGEITEDWKMWVPVGGYLTSIALRAAEAASTMARPLSVSCHYLHEATFGAGRSRGRDIA